MLGAQLVGPGLAEIREIPRPVPAGSDVLIYVSTVGICRTDISMFSGETSFGYPRVSGHEFSGTIVEIGPDVHDFKVGDRVTVDPNLACGYCAFCKRNEPNQCVNHRAIGLTQDGGFEEYALAPESNVFSIGAMPFSIGAFVEPLACVVWGLKRVDVQAGDTALVFGSGTMGILIAQALKASGAATVVVTDPVKWRLDQAEKSGATHTVIADANQDASLKEIAPLGYDIVVDATGITRVLEQAIGFARPRGRVWIFGVISPSERASFSPFDVFYKDLSIIGSHAVNRTFPESIALLESGTINVAHLITHQLPLAQYADAIAAAASPDCLKVQVIVSPDI